MCGELQVPWQHNLIRWITGQRNLLHKVSQALGRLSESSPAERHQTVNKVRRAEVVSTLLHGCETWIAFRRHIKELQQFHTRALRTIMGIRWQDRVTNQEVLDRAGSASMESMILKAELRWTGHVIECLTVIHHDSCSTAS